MKYERFEQLPVWPFWSDAIALAVQVYAMTESDAFKGKGSLRDQIERAAVSVSNNIAEGFERGATQELLTFLYIARGSAGEVRSMLLLFERMTQFSNLKSQISNLKFEIPGRARLPAIARMGREPAEFRNQRPAVFDRQGSPRGATEKRAG